MNKKQLSKGITRRESLKIGAGLVAGIAVTSSGLSVLANETTEEMTPLIFDTGVFPFMERGLISIQNSLDWIHDALVVAMPAAAVGGCQAGIYTPAENGVRPWRQALIRWLTSRSVRGNGSVLIRQEGSDGGAGLSAVVDPNADYLFEVLIHLPGKGSFGEEQDNNLQIWITVMDINDRVLAEAPAQLISGDWSPASVSFASGSVREVRCIVRARSPQKLPCFYFAEGYCLTRKDHAWWNPQNIFNGSRTAARLPDKRELLIKTMDPDIVAGHNGVYLNWDGLFTKRGIAVGGGQWEQEYNHLSIDDPMVDHFRNNGMARELDGKEIHASLLWPGYHMCHHSQEWHSYYKQQFTRIAPEVQFLSQDNVCNPSFLLGKKACFCNSCRDRFREWLLQRAKAVQSQLPGTYDPTSIDIGEYVRKSRETIEKGRDAVLADPVLRAYIQFNYASQAELWRDAMKAAKETAGHLVAICGNQWGAGGGRPYSVTISQVSDVISTETGVGEGSLTSQARAWNALATKLGQASGEYRRPVWLFLTSLFSASQAAKSRLQMINAQSWADGGVPLPWATVAGASGWFYDTEASMCRFIQRHRALFSRRDRCANVGLVYSLPTHAWRHFPAFGLSPRQYQQWFGACAQLLEEMHVPYEVNCWWHPLLGNDIVSLERLSRYKVLVLPGVDCFTDGQRDAVSAFRSRGGRVISVTCPTHYDADAVRRNDGKTLVTHGKGLIEINPDILTRFAMAGENPASGNIRDIDAMKRKLQLIFTRAIGEDPELETDAPSDIWINMWMDNTRKVLALHLVNGNIDVENDKFRAVEGSHWKVRLPSGLSVTEALAISPDTHDDTESLPVEVTKGWATVTVPCIESYTIIALYSGNALKEAEKMSQDRRKQWHASIIDESRVNS
jgi:hypothetical protein